MISVNTHEAKTNLSKLLKLVSEKHEVVHICRNGKVIADLVEPKSSDNIDPLARHPEIMGVKVKGDLTQPFMEDEWSGLYK